MKNIVIRERVLFGIFICIVLAAFTYVGLQPSTEEINLADSLDRVFVLQQILADYVAAVARDLTELVGGEVGLLEVRCVAAPLEDDTFLRLIYELSEKLGVDAPQHTYDMVVGTFEEMEE